MYINLPTENKLTLSDEVDSNPPSNNFFLQYSDIPTVAMGLLLGQLQTLKDRLGPVGAVGVERKENPLCPDGFDLVS